MSAPPPPGRPKAVAAPSGSVGVSLLGDARVGKLPENLLGFGRALRRAGLRIDSGQLALAQQAVTLVGLERRDDVCAALEAVLVHDEPERALLRELFAAYFRDPQVANKLLAQMLPRAESTAEPPQRRPRVQDALAAVRAAQRAPARPPEEELQFDAAMSASDLQRLRHADFNGLSAAEFQLVERLVQRLRLQLPEIRSRRQQAGERGSRLHWARMAQASARQGGDCLRLPRQQPRWQSLPVLLLVDVSGSMERYARLLLAFLHGALRSRQRRDVFAFGTHLTDLAPAFRLRDADDMLAAAATAIEDFAGGTRLGESLAELRQRHARRFVGRRTLVLLISDGLDTGEPAVLDTELRWLKRHSRRLLWLNPLLRFDGYTPAARAATVLHRHADRLVAVHNLEHLSQLANSLEQVLDN